MNSLPLLIIIMYHQIILNFASASSNTSLHTIEEHNHNKGLPYKVDISSQRFRRQSSMNQKRQLISVPGYRVDDVNPTQSSTIFCPVNPLSYPLKSVVISNIGSMNEATLSVPNQPRSHMTARKTRQSIATFTDPPQSRCYSINLSSQSRNANPTDMSNIKVQFIYDSSDIGTNEMPSGTSGSPYLPSVENTNTSCGTITCQNGGVCLNMGANKYGCQCDSSGQWLGKSCSILNPCMRIPCLNAGQCYYLPDATYYCTCYPGYSGNNCQYSPTKTTTTTTVTTKTTARPSNPCLSNRLCFNGGTCVPKGVHGEFTCICPWQYTGTQCQSSHHLTTARTITTSAPNTCGIRELKPRIDSGNRIINGHPVDTHIWPWIVSLQTGGSHFCGGTLIDTHHVITAAHCFDASNKSPHMYKVVAGLLNLRQTHLPHVQQLTIDRIFRHEQYSSTKLINDIAVLKLRTPAKITSEVYPICLPNSDIRQDPQVGQIVQIAGWGYTNSAKKQIPQQLQEASIEILNSNGDSYGGPGCGVWAQRGHSVDTTRQICAMSRDTRTDSCNGDSGGPLIRNIDRKWYLFGIVSYGDAICASSKAAGVYTRVSAYIPWIQQKLKLK